MVRPQSTRQWPVTTAEKGHIRVSLKYDSQLDWVNQVNYAMNHLHV
jgi:hypothetical protein